MEKQCDKKSESGSFLAYVLIIVGILWILKRGGWEINLPGFHEFFSGIANVFRSLASFSTEALIPIVLIFLGIMVIAGRKVIGAIILVLILLLIVPHFLIIPGIILIVFFPIILIILGIILISKLL